MLKLLSSNKILRLFLTNSKSLIKRNYAQESGFQGLAERGFWNDRFPDTCLEFEKGLTSKSLTVYGGFDPTSDSLHIGNLMVLNALIHFQRSGHSVIALVGEATARLGDPSGKKEERSTLGRNVITENCKGIIQDIENVFNNHREYIWKKEHKLLKPVRIINNLDFYKGKDLVEIFEFFETIGKAVSIAMLLGRSFVKSRISSAQFLSYSEFSYQVFQAYDWLHLYKNHNCSVQVGGSDQMGNIHTGYDLIKKMEDYPVTGLTVPLITSESGDKFGKTAGTPVWLNKNKTTPFEFYQYFLRTKDTDVEKYLKLLTFIPLSEIRVAMEIHKEHPELLRPQKRLAEHLTLLVHGERGLKIAKQGTDLLFGGNSGVLADIKAEDLIELFRGTTLKSLLLKPGMSVLELAMMAECFSTEKRAMEIIEAGGFAINQAKVTQPLLVLIPGVHILPNGLTLLKVGKRNYYLVQWTNAN